ncbi:3-dehydroquinate synthase [Streptomyces griseoloalbus]
MTRRAHPHPRRRAPRAPSPTTSWSAANSSANCPVSSATSARRVAVLHPEALAETGDALRADLAGQGYEAVAIQVPNAEEAKTAEVAAYCWKALGQTGFTRTDVVVGVGGGATTDSPGSSPRPGCGACAGSPCRPPCWAWSTRPCGGKTRHQHRRGQEPRRLLPPARRRPVRPRRPRLPPGPRLRLRARRGHQGRLHCRPGDPRPDRVRPRGRPHPRRAAHRRADRTLDPGEGRRGLQRPQGVRPPREPQLPRPHPRPRHRADACKRGPGRPRPLELERRLVDHGADGPAFPTSVATGPNAGRPGHRPTDRRVEEGDFLSVCLGATYRGYRCEIGRTFVIGTAPADWQIELYDLWSRPARGTRVPGARRRMP